MMGERRERESLSKREGVGEREREIFVEESWQGFLQAAAALSHCPLVVGSGKELQKVEALSMEQCFLTDLFEHQLRK